MDDPRMHDYNKDKKVADFIAAVNDQVTHDDGGVKHLNYLSFTNEVSEWA